MGILENLVVWPELSHQLDDCEVVEGDLVIDGSAGGVLRMASGLRKVKRVLGNVIIKNLRSDFCELIKNLKYIDGDLIFENNPYLRRTSLSLRAVNGKIRMIRTPQLCWEVQKLRKVVQAFKMKHIYSDCANSKFKFKNQMNRLFVSVEMDTLFEEYEEKCTFVEIIVSLCVLASILIFVCYVMIDVVIIFLKSLNFTRWRKIKELDIHLKTDPTAYLDEKSSDEEPDVMTWKRRILVKNRLDGRDVMGEKRKKEMKEYRANRKTINWRRKLGALTRSIQKNESDSEFSGQSWLRRKESRKNAKEMNEDQGKYEKEGLPIAVLTGLGETKWKGRTKNMALEARKADERELEYFEAVHKAIKEIIDDAEGDEEDRILMILEIMEKRKIIEPNEIITDTNKFEELLVQLENHLSEREKEKWIAWAKRKQQLRETAITTYGKGKSFNIYDKPVNLEEDYRLNAGVDNSEMFVKVKIETMNWRSSDESGTEDREL